MRKVCKGCFWRLIGSARFWAVLIVTALYLDRVISPIRELALARGLTLTFQGFAVYLLNDSTATALMMAACLALLFDLPCTDELQRYLMLRTGRRRWAGGQLLYIACAVTAYLLCALAISALMLLPCLKWGAGWGGMREIVEEIGYDGFGDTVGMLYYDVWLPRSYESPAAALAAELLAHIPAFTLVASIVMCLNLYLSRRLGYIGAAIPIGLDIMLQEYFGVGVSYVSPLTLCRLSGLDYGDDMGRPPLWYAAVFLIAALALASAVFIRGVRHREVRL